METADVVSVIAAEQASPPPDAAVSSDACAPRWAAPAAGTSQISSSAPFKGRSGVTLRLRPPRGPLAKARLRADARGRDGGVREELAAGVILVCAANCPIDENNSSLEVARVHERTLDDNSLG